MLAGTRRRWALLVVALAFGVALMHTLGHAVDDHGGGMASGPVAVHPHGIVDELFASSWPGLAPAAPRPAVHDPAAPRHGMDPSLMCLAIMAGLLLVLLVAERWRWPGAPAGRSASRPAVAWRHPPWRPVGSAVAELSVMRI